MGRRSKRAEAPLSLFSFQDIMACLTGVLILVSLLLAIDGLSDVIKPSAGTPQAPSEDLSERIEEARRRVEELAAAVAALRGGVDVTEQEVVLLESRVDTLSREVSRERSVAAAAAADAARTRDEIESVRTRAETLERRLAQALQEIEDQGMRERVQFRAGERFAKAPVLVEVGSGGITVGELDDRLVPRLLERLDGPDAERRLDAVLAARPHETHYVLFVVHEDAIPRMQRLQGALIDRGYENGWQLWDAASEGGFLDRAGKAGARPAGPADPPASPAPPATPPAAGGGAP
jgi:outer membrane murein-binding lipoprotein Lpp